MDFLRLSTQHTLSSLLAATALLFPVISFAQTPTTFTDFVLLIVNFINVLIPALFALLFLYFVWKVIDSWVFNAADENKRAEGKRFLWIAILVFVLMIVAWGLIRIIKTSIFG